MVVAWLVGVIFFEPLRQIEAQSLAEFARRVARRDQMIGDEEPKRLFLAFELGQAQMLQMNLREAFVALRPKLARTPQFGELGGIDRASEGNREQRQNAILAGKIERRRTAAPHQGDKGPGAEHEASLGEGQGPAGRAPAMFPALWFFGRARVSISPV